MSFLAVFTLVFLGLALLLALSIYGLGLAIKRQANKPVKRFFAPVPTPATFSFQVLEGRVEKVIENVTGWRLDKEGRFEIDDSKGKNFGTLAKYLGVLWLGIYSTIKVFERWQWPEFRQVKNTENGKEVVRYEVKAREANVYEFYFQFPYSVLIEDIELDGNIRVSLNAVFTVFFLNPVRAIFLNKDPVDLFIAMVRSAVRAWMSGKNFDLVKQITVSSNQSADQIPEFWQMLEELNGLSMSSGVPNYATENPRGLYGKLGIVAVRVELEQITAVGEAAAALEATQLAELRGQAKIVEAKRAAEAVIAKAEGDAAAMDKQMEARERWVQRTIVAPTGGAGPHVANVLVAEQVASAESSISTWVNGGGAMVAIPPSGAPKKP